MIVAVAKETYPHERRVALVPAAVAALLKLNQEVLVQAGAGVESGYADQQYREKGARIVESRADVFAADIVLPIPSSIVGTMLGARLGFWPGLLAIVAGTMTGQGLAYAVSRWLLRRKEPGLPTAPSLIALFLSRPVPVLAEAMAFAAGAARVDFPQFLLVAGAGNLLYAGALAANGAALLPGSLLGPGLILPMLVPVAAWLAWRGWLRWRANEE